MTDLFSFDGITELLGGTLDAGPQIDLVRGGVLRGTRALKGEWQLCRKVLPVCQSENWNWRRCGFAGLVSINIEVKGITPGVEHDRVTLIGGAALEGQINICPVDGFIPNAGDRFEIVRFSQVTFHRPRITVGLC